MAAFQTAREPLTHSLHDVLHAAGPVCPIHPSIHPSHLSCQVFFHGGLYANDAATPVQGSALEVLDLPSLAPVVVQVARNDSLASSRYRHHLAAWRGQLLAVGGQVDDADGASRQTLTVVALDLNSRQWRLVKEFRAGSSGEQ